MSVDSVKSQLTERVFRDVEEITEANIEWEKFAGKKVMITGAGGFISYYLTTSLLNLNYEKNLGIQVFGLVRHMEAAEKKYGKLADRDDFMLIQQDVCDPFDFVELDGLQVDFLIHAASQADAWHFENDPVGTIRANLVGTDNVLQYAKECGAEVLIVSSLKTYGNVTDGSESLLEETQGYVDPDSYKNCYAMGKRAAETLAASYAQQYGMTIKIARPSYIYGAASLTDNRVWAQFMANVVKGEDILLKSNGATFRSFCYVTDTARALFTILLEGKNMQPYNIASDKGNVTIRDFARLAAGAFPERNIKLIFANKEDEVEPVQDFSKNSPEILNPEKLEGLGWEASVDITEGVRRAVAVLEERL